MTCMCSLTLAMAVWTCSLYSASIGVVFFHNQRAAELRALCLVATARNEQLPLFEVHLDCVTKPPVMP